MRIFNSEPSTWTMMALAYWPCLEAGGDAVHVAFAVAMAACAGLAMIERKRAGR